MPNTLETIVELNQVLGSLRAARSRLEDVPDAMKELHRQFLEQKEKLDQLQAIVEESELERRAAEGSAAECQVKVDHYQEQIPKVSTQREYGALLTETDAAKESMRAFEDRALAALERAETAKTEREALESEFMAVDAQYKEQLAEWEGNKPSVAKQIDDLAAQSEVLRERLSPGPRKQYERLYDRHQGEPMAVIAVAEKVGKAAGKFYSCSSCNYEVRPQVIVEIRNKGDLQQCERCYRLFYLADED